VSTSRGHEPGRSQRQPNRRRDRQPSRGAGDRRRSRERALELAYEAESKGLSPADLLSELAVAPAEFAVQLVEGLTEHLGEIDRLVSEHSSGWAVDRMPAVDRCILRIATYELLGELGVPVAVVIDEAVELAKEYSTEDSGRFVNGVLAAIADAVRPAEGRRPGGYR
jgi:N utilization substance protein B